METIINLNKLLEKTKELNERHLEIVPSKEFSIIIDNFTKRIDKLLTDYASKRKNDTVTKNLTWPTLDIPDGTLEVSAEYQIIYGGCCENTNGSTIPSTMMIILELKENNTVKLRDGIYSVEGSLNKLEELLEMRYNKPEVISLKRAA